MNVGQICRQALIEANVVRQDGSVSPLFAQDEMLRWANEGYEEAQKVLRNAEMDYLWTSRAYHASNSFTFENEDYALSSLRLSNGTRQYTLPPDLLILKAIRCTTTGQEQRSFRPMDQSDPYFQTLERSTTPPTDPIYWDQVDRSTLLLANDPETNLDLSISYVRRSPKLMFYNTGTVAVNKDAAAVTGTSTVWEDEEFDDALVQGALLEIYIHSGTAVVNITGSTTPWVALTKAAVGPYKVSALASDTALTIASNWRPANVTGRGYYLASVPELPEEQHNIITEYVVTKIFGRLKARVSKQDAQKDFQQKLTRFRSDIQERQTVEPEFVQDYDPDEYY